MRTSVWVGGLILTCLSWRIWVMSEIGWSKERMTHIQEFWRGCECTKACCVWRSCAPTCKTEAGLLLQCHSKHPSWGKSYTGFQSCNQSQANVCSGGVWVKHILSSLLTTATLNFLYSKYLPAELIEVRSQGAHMYRKGLKWSVKAVMLWMYIM